MTREKDVTAEIPGVEEIARLIARIPPQISSERRDGIVYVIRDHRPSARAILDRVAPVLAEKERAELVLCDLMNAAGHYIATHSEIDREVLSATIKKAADYLEAASIWAQGE